MKKNVREKKRETGIGLNTLKHKRFEKKTGGGEKPTVRNRRHFTHVCCVPSLSLSADTKHGRKEKKERGENTERRFALSCGSVHDFIGFFFCISHSIYTHEQTGNLISETTQIIIRRLEKEI